MTDQQKTPRSIENLREKEKQDIATMPSLPESTSGGPLFDQVRNDPTFGVLNPDVFEHIWRIGTALSRSQLIPKQFQGKPDDCFIAAQMAIALRCQPMQVLQNTYIVHGTPGFSAKFAIALANMNGPFVDGLHFKENGLPWSDDNFAVTCYAKLKKTGAIVDRTVSIRTAKAEGWYKNNPKYQSMPDQMLSYRAAMFLIRLYCPEVLFGMQSAEELQDIDIEREPIDVVSYGTEPEPRIERDSDKKQPAPEKDEDKTPTPDKPTQNGKSATAEKAGEIAERIAEKQASQPEQSGPTFEEVSDMIDKADFTSEDDRAQLQDLIKEFDGPLKEELLVKYNARAKSYQGAAGEKERQSDLLE